MNKTDTTIEKICTEVVESLNFMLIDVEITNVKDGKSVEVFLDGLTPLSIDDCSAISRKINEDLETALPDVNFSLDVSSPGVSRPIKYIAQLIKHVGRNFEVKYRDEADAVKKIIGKLISAENDTIVISKDNVELPIAFNKIISLKVKISFS